LIFRRRRLTVRTVSGDRRQIAGSGGGYQQLLPRQQINHSPYSFRSLNAASADTATNSTQLGGIAAGQYVLTSDARLSDARPPTSGSAKLCSDRTSQQASTDFNISGDGTAGGMLSGKRPVLEMS